MKIKFFELKNQIDSNKISPVYVFYGEDAYFRDYGVKLLLNKLVAEPSLNFLSLSGASEFSEAIDSLYSFPLMSEKRLTLIKDFNADKNSVLSLKKYLENPSLSSVLVISNENLPDAIEKIDGICFVDCSKADETTLVKWVVNKSRQEGVLIDSQVARLVVDYCLCDMSRISNETEKLIAYRLGGEIKKEDVELLVSKDTEFKIYEMTDCIGKKNINQALFIILELLGKGETTQRLISGIYNYFRRLLFVSLSTKSEAETGEMLGIKEYAVKKAKEQAKMFKVTSLKKAVDNLGDADYKIKSGKADVDEEFWLNVFRIMIG